MAGNWNPNYPSVLGLEWLGHYEIGDDYFGTHSPIRGQILRSTVAQTVDAFRLGIMPTVNSSLPLFLLLDVYPIGNLPANPDDVQIDRYPPDAQVSIGSWLNQAGSGTTIYTSIDETNWTWPLTAAQNADFIRTRNTVSTQAIFHMNTGAFSLTRRPARLRIRAVAACKTGFRSIRFALRHVPSGEDYRPTASLQRTNGYTSVHDIDLGEINPVTLRPWSALDVRSFEAGVGTWAVIVQGGGSTTNELQVKALELEVQSVPQDHACRAVWQRPSGAPRSPILFDDVFRDDGAGGYTANWSKPVSGDFLFVPRKANDPLVSGGGPFATDIRWQFIGGRTPAGPEPPPVPGMRATHVSYGNTLGEIWAMSSPEGDLSEAFPPTIPAPTEQGRLDLMVAGVVSDDSQPYGFHHFVKDNHPTFLNQIVGMVMVPSTSDSWIGVRGIIRPPLVATPLGGGRFLYQIPKPGERTARISIHLNSDDSQVPGSGFFDLDAAELHAGPYIPNMPGYRFFEKFLSAGAALTASTQYYIRLLPLNGPTEVASTSDLESWAFTKPDGYNNTGVGADAGSATFQGDTLGTGGYAIYFDGSSWFSFTDVDLAFQLLEQPDPPEDFMAVSDTQEPTGPDRFCSVPGIDFIRCTWESPNTYGLNFLQWEIERLAADDAEWVPVATASDHSTRTFDDYTTIRNRPARYRVRAVMVSGAISEWVESTEAIASSYGCEVLFVSNERPDLNVAYDHDPAVDFTFQDHLNDELMVVTGSPYQVAFVDPTDRGVVVSYQLIANFGQQPERVEDGSPIGAEAVFEPLRRIARSDYDVSQLLPYVTVLDWLGNRRFAYLRLGKGTKREPGFRYHVDVDVVPLTITPVVTQLPGSEGVALLFDTDAGHASTPDHANFATTDLDAEVVIALPDWTPAQPVVLASQADDFLFLTGSQLGWWVLLQSDGSIALGWSTDGTGATDDSIAVAPLNLVPGTEHKISWTFDVNNGAGGKTFEVKVDDTVHDTEIEAGTTSIHNSTAPVRVGWIGLNGDGGYVKHYRQRATIGGTLVADADFTAELEGTTSFADDAPTPKTWTMNAGSRIGPI